MFFWNSLVFSALTSVKYRLHYVIKVDIKVDINFPTIEYILLVYFLLFKKCTKYTVGSMLAFDKCDFLKSLYLNTKHLFWKDNFLICFQ